MPHKDQDKTLNQTEEAGEPIVDTPEAEGGDTANATDDRLASLESELAEVRDQHMRLMAEYDNYRKRTTREREALYGDIQGATLKAFLPVADNFARAMEAPTTDPDFKKGMELIHTGFTETLARFGVERFGAVGEPFDPGIHEAVAHMEDEEAQAGCICQVYSPGYRMGDKILRPATVVVAN